MVSLIGGLDMDPPGVACDAFAPPLPPVSPTRAHARPGGCEPRDPGYGGRKAYDDRRNTWRTHIAHAETEISASPDQVWGALTDPEAISAFMFGSKVETDWQVGSPITWTGEYDGKPFTDKGEILQVDEPNGCG